MNEIQKIRLKNANDILKTLCESKTKVFAEQIDRTASYVSTYISGKDPKPISDKVAHTIEVAFNLPSGRLDEITPLFENNPTSNIETISSKMPDTRSTSFSLSMFPEIEAGIATKEHASKVLSKGNIEAQIPSHFNKIGAMNFISDMVKKAAMEMEILARDIRLDVMLESINEIQEGLTSLGLHIENQNLTSADASRSRLCRTMLVTDQWSNKKYLITVAGLKFGFIVRTLTQEYDALRSSELISNDIDGSFTIILREDDDVIGGLIPLIFENKELSNFDILSSTARDDINFTDTLRFINEGLLEISNIEVLFGKKPKRLEVTPDNNGKPKPLKALIDSAPNEISGRTEYKNEILSLSGTLYRKDIRQDLAIDNIAYAYNKITGIK